MPSQAFDTGWDFGPVLSLIESDLHVASPTSSPPPRPTAPEPVVNDQKDASTEGRLQLGSFEKLFQELGMANYRPPSPISPVNPATEEPIVLDHAELGTVWDPNRATETASPIAEASCPEPQASDATGSALEEAPELSKRQAAKQASKKARKERKAIEKQERKKIELGNKRIEMEPAQQEEARKQAEQPVMATPDTSSSQTQPAQAQPRNTLRSNVGAKIRPSTPVQIDDTPVPVKTATSPTKKNNKSVKQTKTPAAAKKGQMPVMMNTNQIGTLPPAFSPSGFPNALAQPFLPSTTAPLSAFHQAANAETSIGTHVFIHGSPIPIEYKPQPIPGYPNHAGYPGYPGYPYGSYPTSVIVPAGYPNGLIPSAVLPVVQPRPTHQTVNAVGTPSKASRRITIRPRLDRHVHFHGQLMSDFPEERKWLVAPMQLCNDNLTAEGIHVFVDASNIMIGFKDMLRRNGMGTFDLSFDSLALLMERRRPVAKRVSASSHREAAPLPHVTKLVDTSKAVGYENNVKEQVFIRREDSERKKFFKAVDKVGWTKAMKQFPASGSGSGSGSDSETGPATPATPSAPKWVEQGVDEILHLKMCQSIIDADVPTTIVLATGDGAEAEHSDGFLAHVERALKKGWKVELLSWRQQLNGGYKNRKFASKWAGQFRIIELDDYLESLIDTP